jgi:putative transposase
VLGIDLDRIPPGRPDQNGSHERMHRDIALELEAHSAADFASQQAALDTWRASYNQERPHEAIGLQTPAALYQSSPRRFEPHEIALEYPLGYLRRRVSSNGAIRLKRSRVRVSESLAGWDVGLQVEKPSRYGLWFCRLRLGEVDLDTQEFYAAAAASERGGSAPTPPGFSA